MTNIMLCCLEQKDAYGNGAQAEQGTISKRNRIFHAVHCKDGCSALQERLQCTASEMGKTGIVIASPVLNKRKGRKKRNTQDTFLYAEGVLPVWDLKKRTKC